MLNKTLSDDCLEIRHNFFSLKSKQDLAELLGIKPKDIDYYLYRPKLKRYHQFRVKKKNGGQRILYEPIPGLKIIQQKLNKIFNCVYLPPESVHGFVAKRSIATNAVLHEGSKYILNIDLKDFFPSINFGRVRGLFLAYPYKRQRGRSLFVIKMVR